MHSLKSLLIVFAMFAIASCSQESKKAESTVSKEDYILTEYPGGGGLQKAVKKDKQLKVVEEGDMLNGKKEGTWVTYFVNSGLISSVTSYKDGKKHGLMLKADETGGITEKMFYINDQLEGQRLVYNRTRVKEEANYKNGKLEGPRKLYYDNAKLQEEGVFKNGKREGKAIWYDQEGNKTIEYTYKDGEKVE
ncbi:MAG: toxin-antitoxin system YwqK family antitoxin [Sphingobacteriales bacterium]|nr:MAG: toxin-antitoxin system YwqK family antitoxin [Sphingobacteriales bacterium]